MVRDNDANMINAMKDGSSWLFCTQTATNSTQWSAFSEDCN